MAQSEDEDEVELEDVEGGDPDDVDHIEGADGGLALFLDEAPIALLQPAQAPVEEEPTPIADASSAQAHDAAPVPPPVPPPPEVPRVRGNAAVLVTFPWGRIAYYESKRSFEAVCRNPAHGKCVLTRSSRGRGGGPGVPPRGGRPLGLMAAWLLRGNVAGKGEHWAPANLHGDRSARRAGRNFIKAPAHGFALLSHERPKADGEGSEPEDLSHHV